MLSRNRVKYIQSLGQKKFRDEYGVFIAEGPKVVLEFIRTQPGRVKEILAVREWISAHPMIPANLPVEEISPEELERISQLQTPNQVLAVIEKNEPVPAATYTDTILLALDTIQDPGNLGTIIRIADWYGLHTVICSQDSADCYNSKVVQSTMGSLARVRVEYTASLPEWIASQQDRTVYAAALDGQPVNEMGKIEKAILVIGNESKGIQESILATADHRITIPRIGQAESLNAAVATAIILSHVVDQPGSHS